MFGARSDGVDKGWLERWSDILNHLERGAMGKVWDSMERWSDELNRLERWSVTRKRPGAPER